MLVFEIAGGVIGYLLLGVPAVRLMHMMTKQKEVVKDLAGLLLAMWPLGLATFGLCAVASLAFKWGADDS